MQVVMNIPDRDYEILQMLAKTKRWWENLPEYGDLILNGIPLPKGVSLIIPELSMPENCNECPCYYDGYCRAFEESKNVDYNTGDKKRMDYCPLIEVK